jgi:hypothetical protein
MRLAARRYLSTQFSRSASIGSTLTRTPRVMSDQKQLFENVAESVRFPQVETEVLKYWTDIDAFQTSLKMSEGRPVYTFYDGPPFATGLPHYGHILAGTIKVINHHVCLISFADYRLSMCCVLRTLLLATGTRTASTCLVALAGTGIYYSLSNVYDFQLIHTF